MLFDNACHGVERIREESGTIKMVKMTEAIRC